MLLTKRSYKKIIRLILVFLVIPGSYAVFIATKKLYQETEKALFVPSIFNITFHSWYNAKLKAAVELFTKQYFAGKPLTQQSFNTFEEKLKKAYPVVEKLQLQLSPPNALYATIEGVQPRYNINQTHIAGTNGRLLGPRYFPEVDAQQLEAVTIDQKVIKKHHVSAAAKEFLAKLSPEMTSQYNITYYTKDKIVLVPKKSLCRCMIITNLHQLFNHKKLDALNGIFQDLCNKGFITKKYLEAKGTPLAFDLRVSGQIIVRFFKPATRGRGA